MQKLLIIIIILLSACQDNEKENEKKKNINETYYNSGQFSPQDYSVSYQNEEAEKLYNYGTEEYYKTEFKKAIQYYIKSINIEPTAAAYNELGVAYNTLNDFSKSTKSFEKSIEIDSTFWSAYFNLANTYAIKNEYDSSEIVLKKIIIKSNSEFWKEYSYLHLAAIYYNQYDFEKANGYIKKCKNLEKHTEINPFYTKIKNKIIAQME